MIVTILPKGDSLLVEINRHESSVDKNFLKVGGATYETFMKS